MSNAVSMTLIVEDLRLHAQAWRDQGDHALREAASHRRKRNDTMQAHCEQESRVAHRIAAAFDQRASDYEAMMEKVA